MNPTLVSWLKDRSVNVIIYGTIILTIGFALYKIFLSPSTKNSNLYTAPSSNNHLVENPNYAPLSCATIKVVK